MHFNMTIRGGPGDLPKPAPKDIDLSPLSSFFYVQKVDVAMIPDTPLIVALDFPCMSKALDMADRLNPQHCRVKVGKELFTAAGREVIEHLHKRGFDVFLDLKFHDIPHTAAQAVRAAAALGVWMVNVHASGGRRMLEACRQAADQALSPPRLVAVTVLTSLSNAEMAELGWPSAGTQVMRLAKLASATKMDGVVCSAQESAALKSTFGPQFTLVTPGIRFNSDSCDDQVRTDSPLAAVRNGSDYLVVGRPITQSPNPQRALEQLRETLQYIRQADNSEDRLVPVEDSCPTGGAGR